MSESEEARKNKFLGGKKHKKRPAKTKSPKWLSKPLIILGLVILICSVFWAVQLRPHHQLTENCKQPYTYNCALVSDAVPLLDGNKQSQLKKVVDKIKTVKGYDKDTNLTYVVTIYYFNERDMQNAQLYYDKLKIDYKPKDGYNTILESKALSLQQIKDSISYVNKYQSLNKPSVTGLPAGE